jgi:hypothetical protein
VRNHAGGSRLAHHACDRRAGCEAGVCAASAPAGALADSVRDGFVTGRNGALACLTGAAVADLRLVARNVGAWIGSGVRKIAAPSRDVSPDGATAALMVSGAESAIAVGIRCGCGLANRGGSLATAVSAGGADPRLTASADGGCGAREASVDVETAVAGRALGAAPCASSLRSTSAAASTGPFAAAGIGSRRACISLSDGNSR